MAPPSEALPAPIEFSAAPENDDFELVEHTSTPDPGRPLDHGEDDPADHGPQGWMAEFLTANHGFVVSQPRRLANQDTPVVCVVCGGRIPGREPPAGFSPCEFAEQPYDKCGCSSCVRRRDYRPRGRPPKLCGAEACRKQAQLDRQHRRRRRVSRGTPARTAGRQKPAETVVVIRDGVATERGLTEAERRLTQKVTRADLQSYYQARPVGGPGSRKRR